MGSEQISMNSIVIHIVQNWLLLDIFWDVCFEVYSQRMGAKAKLAYMYVHT